MIIGTIETLESFLDGFWKDHRAEVDQEEFEKVRNLASIYSRLVITSFISSSIGRLPLLGSLFPGKLFTVLSVPLLLLLKVPGLP